VVSARRGELWTFGGGGGQLTSKARPCLIVQSDLFASADFVTIALVTLTFADSLTRVPVTASKDTGLDHDSFIMADKIHTITRTSLRQRIGHVSKSVMADVERSILVYLGIAE